VTRNVYTANVVGENLIANDMEAGTDPTPLLVGSEGLIVLYGDRSSGLTALVLADDEDEGEAIILRAFGDEAFVDSIEVIAPVPPEIERGIRNLAHAGTACSDPDCEIHHPEVIESQAERATALAWFNAGKREAGRALGLYLLPGPEAPDG
jgi:hypothetical protein